MKLTNVVLLQLDGETPAPASENISGKGPDLTLARVLTNAALSPDTRGGMAPVSTEDSVLRYELSIKLFNTAVGEEFTVPNSLIAKLQPDINRLYAPLISGQVNKMFENAKADQ